MSTPGDEEVTHPNLTQRRLEKVERLTDRGLRKVADGLNWIADRQGSWIIVAVLLVVVLYFGWRMIR